MRKHQLVRAKSKRSLLLPTPEGASAVMTAPSAFKLLTRACNAWSGLVAFVPAIQSPSKRRISHRESPEAPVNFGRRGAFDVESESPNTLVAETYSRVGRRRLKSGPVVGWMQVRTYCKIST